MDLDELTRQARNCRICRDSPLGEPLPHEPRPVLIPSRTARICIASQAPGIRVHRTGLPFNDPSGDRLRDWLGVTRDEFYDPARFAILPMGFCFPGYDRHGGDLPPRPECRATWHDRFFRMMPQLELVLVIGLYAQRYHLPEEKGKSLTETVGNWRTLLAAPRRPHVLPLPHPSWRNNGWLKRNPWFEREVLPVLRKEVQRLTAGI